MPLFSTIFARRRAAFRLAFVATALLTALAAFGATRSASADDGASVLSPIASLIDAKTLCVGRVDLANVDFDRLGETLDATFAQTLKSARFSDESIALSQKEFAKTLDALKKKAREGLDAFKRTNGLREAFFVAQNARGDGLAIVVPVADATREQIDSLKALAGAKGWNCAVYQKTLLVATPRPLKEFGAFYKTFAPGSNVDFEKFFRENAGQTVALYCGRFRIRAALDAATGGAAKIALSAQSAAVRSALEVFDSSIVDVGATVDAGALSARTSFRFSSAVAAGQMREQLGKVVDAYVDERFDETLATNGVDLSDKRFEQFNLVPLFREAQRGSLRSRLPRQEGARLIFEFNFVDEAKKSGSASALVGLAVAFPAIQAARAQALRNREQLDFDDEIQFDDDAQPDDAL